MDPATRQAASRTLLDAGTLERRAGDEISRARRYHRALSVVALELDSAAEQRLIGQTALHLLRRWDLIGLANTDRPTVVVVLPETDRGGGDSFIRRLRDVVSGIPMGTATFPADGGRLETLIEVARWRARNGLITTARLN